MRPDNNYRASSPAPRAPGNYTTGAMSQSCALPGPSAGESRPGRDAAMTETRRDDFAYLDRAGGGAGSNDGYREDVGYAIELNRRIASIIGIWPTFAGDGKRDGGRGRYVAKRLTNTLLYFLLAFLLVPGILHIVLEERTLKRRILKTGPMILNTMALVKYTVMLFREGQIRACIASIESDWRMAGTDELRRIMRGNANVGRRLTRVCALTFYCGGLCYRLIKTLLTPKMHRAGLIVKPLPSPLFAGIFRFNASASPVYEAIFAVQMMGGFAVHSTTITTCSYAAVLATHACGQFDLVVYLLKKLIDNDGDNGRLTRARDVAVSRRLRIIVQLHLRSLRFVGDVEDLLCEICLVEIVGGTMILCLTGYYFIMDLENNDALGILTYFVMITSLIALLFTYCYIGEIITDKAKNVGANTYMIDWYELPPKKGICIGLIISISRFPIKLTAGKMLELSLYNFGCIMKSAAGYLNLLRTMTD